MTCLFALCVLSTSHETQGNWLTLCKSSSVLCSSTLFYYVMYNCEMSGSVGLVFLYTFILTDPILHYKSCAVLLTQFCEMLLNLEFRLTHSPVKLY